MVQIKLTSYCDKDTINIHAWLDDIRDLYNPEQVALLEKVSVFAGLTGKEHATPYGISCLSQGLAMAEILADLELDHEVIAAALLYNNALYADLSLEEITEHLGKNIASLVDGCQRMSAIHEYELSLGHQEHHPKIDNIRRMLLAMVSDVRVVFIKLAERLCVMRNVAIFNQKKQQQIASETMSLYAPLANRLGVTAIKWQLEDLAFYYLNHDEYKRIANSLNDRRLARETYVNHIMESLTSMLNKIGITDIVISGRAKHIYSIHRKMQRKNVNINEIYDAIAIRILVPSIEDCYAALGLVQATWQQIPHEFDDYIATPKPNGYRSIHTALIGPEEKQFEIQIRTHQMHQEAELGGSAHWVYKEGRQQSSDYEDKIAWLRQVMDWQKEVSQETQSETYQQIFDDRVYVFTPNNEVIDLAKGATPLDFAYSIHTEIGHRCKGAKINNAIVPLTYELKTGEQVSILTSKQAQPSRDWLNPHAGYLKTSRAKTKVHNWFNRQDQELHLVNGRNTLDKELRQLHIKSLDYASLSQQLHYKNSDDLLIALGRGDIRVTTVIQAIQSLNKLKDKVPPLEHTLIKPRKLKTHIQPGDIEIEGVGKLLTHPANCCKPLPGDDIVGYVTQTRGITIHRQDCNNMQHAFEVKPERIVEVQWHSENNQHSYPTQLHICAYDKKGLAKEIRELINSLQVNILGMQYELDPTENTVDIYVSLETYGLAPLNKVMTKIRQLQQVIKVKRTGE